MAGTKFWPLKKLTPIVGAPQTFVNVASTTTNQYFGTTIITSRDTFVAAPVVAARSQIWLQPRWIGGMSSYGISPSFHVASIQAGSGFYISTVASCGFGAANTASVSVGWKIEHQLTP